MSSGKPQLPYNDPNKTIEKIRSSILQMLDLTVVRNRTESDGENAP